MGEVYGLISAWCLMQVAKHAAKARDIVTVYRVREVISRGVAVGWDENGADGGKIVPHRDSEVAEKVIARLKEVRDAD
jgi:hypothetical protein